jgi:signal transduction histidine kinase
MKLFSSLTNRIFLASALLAVLSIGMAVYIVNVRVTREAESELQRSLEEAGRLVDNHRGTLFQNSLRMARLVADLPKLKAAVDTASPPTVEPLAQEYRQQLASALLVITHRSGRVLAAVGIPDEPGIVGLPGIQHALEGRETAAFWPTSTGILQVVTVPIAIEPEDILGTLSVGFGIDRGLAERLKALTQSEIAFAYNGRIQAASLPQAFLPDLAALLGTPPSSRLRLGGNEYAVLAQPLLPEDPGGGAEGSPAPTAFVLMSRTERLNFLGPLHTALAGTALIAVALATLLSYGVALTVTRPLRAITATMSEMATTGDLTLKKETPDLGRWQDEDARLLASTFGAMTDALARFQRGAAQRERLASLGRLSTVIAHEVRNPLMIVKAAVRTLRHAGTAPSEGREALADIDGEIARLNRLVNDVLDFARPIRFELALADINAICRASTTAAMAGDTEMEVGLDLDPAVGEVVTDAERLHSALVNILTNARHACAARQSRGSAGPPIELITQKTKAGSIAIVVKDRGIGINEDDLPRVAEPYFTTKRGGTGLGLAIAKNVVEGLGGTLGVESRPGEGTQVRIEIADRAQVAQEEPAI